MHSSEIKEKLEAYLKALSLLTANPTRIQLPALLNIERSMTHIMNLSIFSAVEGT